MLLTSFHYFSDYKATYYIEQNQLLHKFYSYNKIFIKEKQENPLGGELKIHNNMTENLDKN